MKQLQNNFTTVEQSKRLLELGVPVDSADETYQRYYDKNSYDNAWVRKAETFNGIVNDFHIPCWSVGRLIEIILKVPGFPYVGPEKCINLTNRNISKIIDLIIETIEGNLDTIDFSKL